MNQVMDTARSFTQLRLLAEDLKDVGKHNAGVNELSLDQEPIPDKRSVIYPLRWVGGDSRDTHMLHRILGVRLGLITT